MPALPDFIRIPRRRRARDFVARLPSSAAYPIGWNDRRHADFWWKGQMGAMAKIRPYDHSQAGVAYVTKCLNGPDVYEMNRCNDTPPSFLRF